MSQHDRPDDVDQEDEDWDPTISPEEHLALLEAGFLRALEEIGSGNTLEATKLLKEILRAEPRLAEPRLELARLFLEAGNLEEAEAEAREALRLLEAGGQWIEDVPADTLLGLAHGLVAEALRSRCETDNALFGDPDEFKAALIESRKHYELAVRLDPTDDRAAYYAHHLGKEDRDPPREPPAGIPKKGGDR
jgi:tetratricopeptide (TPR) repeat protein